MLHDFRLALRGLRRRPGFTAAAVVTLALGIGASTAIFSVAYGVSLRPLPYPDADRLIRIYEAKPAESQLQHDVSVNAFHAWREGAPSIESAAMFSKAGTRILANTDSQALTLMSVSPGFFDVLGVKPLVGPGFKPENEYDPYTADDEAIMSFEAWQRLFGGRPDVIGQNLEFSGAGDNDIYRIVGVMPEGFAFGSTVDLWRPTLLVELPLRAGRFNYRYDRVVARLHPGATVGRARAELKNLAAGLADQYPQQRGWTVTVLSLHDSIVGAFGRATWLLLAAVAVVLLVACLNVGGLLVARAVARERETAVRVALGAGSWRLLRLWLAEASLVSALGAGLGLLLASLGVSVLKAAAPPGIPRLDAIAVDVPAVIVTAASALFAVLVFTVAPVVLARRRDVVSGFRSGAAAGGDSPRRHAVRHLLMAAQCAGAAALVILAVMLTRSFVKLTAVDLGWDPSQVLSLKPSPPMPRELRRPWARYVEWSNRLIERLEATPGIERAAITTQIPLSPHNYPGIIARGRGKEAAEDLRWTGVAHHVSDGYFDAMQIRLLSGRRFEPSDRHTDKQLISGAEPRGRGVAIVTESTARLLWPGQPPIGQALWLPGNDTVPWREVIGVVEDIQFYAVGEAGIPHVFVPWSQYPTGNPRLIVRGASATPATVKEIVQAVETGTHVEHIASLDSYVSRATAQPRFTTRLVAAFGALALALAAVGIYGTLSFLVGSRTREIGIRLALGASRHNVMSNVVRRGLIPVVLGGVAGLGAALAIARTFRALLFGIEPADAGSFAGGAIVLLAVALAAAIGPALRASRVDPASALRAE